MKAFSPILFPDEGIVIEPVSSEQLENKASAISVSPSGKVTPVIFLQPSKAPFPNFVTEEGISIFPVKLQL